jgi:DNA polymerase
MVGDWEGSTTLRELYEAIRECTRCTLGLTRTNFVFGVGDESARIIFVGEAPGFYEDQQGIPFVGPAGQFLDQLLASIGLERSDIYIANTLKCRPPDNRDPLPEELETCTPYLLKQIEIIKPSIICTLGNHATKTLLGTSAGITALHGKMIRKGGRLYVPLFHPAAALHKPPLKSTLIDDFQKLKEYLEEEEALLEAEGGEAVESAPILTSEETISKTSQEQLELF